MRKNRIDSRSEMQKMAVNAQRKLLPPKHIHMDVRDIPFFESVIEEFARSEWTPHQLELAALLAKTISDLENEQNLLRSEGGVLKSDKGGGGVLNPRKNLVQMYAGTILSMRRSLSLHARAQNGESGVIGKRRGEMKQFENHLAEIWKNDPDGLIARPKSY